MGTRREYRYNIPSQADCLNCHGKLSERVLGFGAIQLSHDLPGVKLTDLVDWGVMTTPPTSNSAGMGVGYDPPGSEAAQLALGYLHANCGNCHNDRPGLALESVPEPQLLLRILVDDMTLEDTGVYQTAINKAPTASMELPVEWRILGGDLGGTMTNSAVYYRMNDRGGIDQMPPIASTEKDTEGLALILSWMQSLPPPAP